VTSPDQLQNFIFRGLLLHSTFEDLEALGTTIAPATEAAPVDDEISLDDFSVAIRVQAVKMATIYQAFFCFENSVRELVEQRLSENLGDGWWDQGTTAPIRKKVSDRKAKEAANRFHSPRGESDIAYADFGDLSLMITNNWPLFEDLFPDQDWVRTRLSDLELSRNVMAHNGVLNGREITRITLYLKDWVMQVG
jgi:Swt1-like HEPN